MQEKIQDSILRFASGFAILLITLFYNHSLALADWTSGERLSTDIWESTPSSSNQNDIAVDSSGNIHVVWIDNRDHLGADFEVYYKKYNSTTGLWGLETQLTDEIVTGFDDKGDPIIEIHDKATPGIVVDSSGNLYVSFDNKTKQKPNVLHYDAGTDSWDSSPTDLGSGGTSNINPVLAVDGSNNIHAVWRGMEAGNHQIFYRKYTPATGWGSTEQLTTAVSDKKTPAIFVDTSGNNHVIWADNRDDLAGHYEIYYKKKPSAGSWGADERRSFDLPSDSLMPYIVSDSLGNLHLVWEDERHGNFEIYYLMWEASSSSWGSEERLTDEPAASKNPHLAVDPSGQVHLLWQDRRYRSGGGWRGFSLFYKKKTTSWGDEARLSRKGYRGAIAADSSSNLHVAYGSDFEVFGTLLAGNPEIYYMKFDPSVTGSPSPSEAILLLDTSGSMGWREDGTIPAFPEQSRLYKAGQALSNFLDRFNLRNPTKAFFGVVTFPHSSGVCPSAKIVTGLTSLNETSRYTAIKNTIPGLTAGGKTPMAEGMTTANGLLSAAVSNKMILLVSDGYHNCPGTSFPAGFLTGFSDPIYTVGIGTAVEVDLPRLQNIAATTGGEFRNATTSTHLNMMSWFKTIIQTLFGLESENDPSGEIRAGQILKHEAWITEHDTDLAFDLSWTTPKEGYIGLKLYTPEGEIVTPAKARSVSGISHISRDTYQIYYLTEEYLKSIERAGSWTMELSGEKIEQGTTEPYHYSNLMDSSLKMLPELNHKTYRTGETVSLQTVVLEKGKRIPADIRMHIHTPNEGLGNWFAKNLVSKDALKEKKKTKSGEPLSDMLRKALVLSEDYQKPFPDVQRKTTHLLYDDGTHGDLMPKDGIYTNLFSDTKSPGTYTFDITAEGKTSNGQRFRRNRIIQRFIQVKVDEEYTGIELKRLDVDLPDAHEYQVTITPKDASGNYLGPGYADRISFFVKGAKFMDSVRDNLDGSYSQRFRIPLSMVGKRNIIRVRVIGVDMVFCL